MLKQILVGAVAVTSLAACGGGYGGGASVNSKERLERAKKFVDWRVDDALDDLDGTDAQKAQVKQVTDKLFVEAAPALEANQAARAGLVEQWGTANPDATKVHAIVDERAQALTGFAHKVADAALELHRILTPEQRAKITKEIQERTSRR
jgi:periplasmic protein CpxP/Spy